MRLFILSIILFLGVFFIYHYSKDIFIKNNESYEVFLEQAIERNKKPFLKDETVIYTFWEFFQPENIISKIQKEQLTIRKAQQTAFFQDIENIDTSNSFQKTDEDIENMIKIEKKIISERQIILWAWRENTPTQNISWASLSQDCAGIIYDPCIVPWEDTPPNGIMKFWTWRGKL